MSYKNILMQELEKNGGNARMVEVPLSRKPTPESLKALNREVSAQISSNEIMRSRSSFKSAR